MDVWRRREEELNISAVSKLLNIPEYRIQGLLRRKTLQYVTDSKPPLFRMDKGISGIEVGTSIFCSDPIEIVRGFPKIQRAIVLDPSIKEHFIDCSEVAVEEKMNGYNVRVASVGGRSIALTRGGFVCPYTTEKVNDILNQKFFIDHPDLVLCGELVGPDNPYVPKDLYGIESVDFFIFDIRKKLTGDPVPVFARRELMDEYGIKSVRLFGVYPVERAHIEIKNIIKGLGAQGREGVVIKDPEMLIPPIKYTSSESNCSDLRYAFEFYNDFGRDFFFGRVVREGFQSVEWNENIEERKKRCHRLGESLLLPMIKTIEKKKQGERITENVQIRVKNLNTAVDFEKHLKLLGIDAIFEEPIPIDGEYLIKIKKIIQSTNDRTEGILKGRLWS